MNVEIEAAGRARLIIPTSLRSDYLAVLEALTLSVNSEPFIAFGPKLSISSEKSFPNFPAQGSKSRKMWFAAHSRNPPQKWVERGSSDWVR